MGAVLYLPVIRLSVITLENAAWQDNVERLVMSLGVVFPCTAAFYSNYLVVFSQLEIWLRSAIALSATCVAAAVSELAVTHASLIPVNLQSGKQYLGTSATAETVYIQ